MKAENSEPVHFGKGSIPGKGNSKVKRPEARSCLSYSETVRLSLWSEQSEEGLVRKETRSELAGPSHSVASGEMFPFYSELQKNPLKDF